MRLLVLTGLLALGLCNASNRPEEKPEKITPFASGKEFTYTYDGQVASGIPGSSSQHAVTRIHAKVALIFNTETSAVLKLRDVKVQSESRELAEPREVLPMAAFHGEETIDEQKLQLLQKPVGFKYSQGLVSQLQFENDEPTWAANIKRAIINMLQVNLKQHGRTDLEEENRLHNSVRDPKDYSNDFFTAYEKTLEGECETMYTVTPWMEGEAINVSKSINFEKCKRRPQIKYNMRFGEQCDQACDNEFADDEKTTKSSTVIKYNISGTIDNFAIERVMVHSQYVFAPMADHSNVLITHVKAHLKLERVGKIQDRIPEPTGGEKEELVYSAEWDRLKEKFIMEGDEEFTKRTPYTQLGNKLEAVEGVLRRLLRAVHDEKNGIQHEATRQLGRLVKLLRLCSEHDLERIHNELFNGNKFEEVERQKVRDLLLDSLAMAGTKVTVDHLVKKIKNREVTPIRAAHAIKALVNIRVPSEQLIEKVLELCKDTSSDRSGALRQSCLLTVGSMMNALCKENEDRLAIHDQEINEQYTTQDVSNKQISKILSKQFNYQKQEKLCSRQTKQRMVEKLFAFFEEAETRYEKVLALRAIANAGLDLSIFKLEELIKDVSEDRLVRSEAIDALRQLRREMPRKIQKMLMPIYLNKRELPSLRIQAFVKILETLPERAILDQLAQSIYRERNTNVHAFAYTMMHTMANSTVPCERQTAEDLQTSLRIARVPEPSQSTPSQYWHIGMYNKEQKIGGAIKMGMMLTNQSYLPAEIMAGLDTVFMGDWVKNLLSVGIVQRDVEPILENLLRSTMGRGLEGILTRGKRSAAGPGQVLRQLFQKLGITSRRHSDEKPFAMAYIRYKDMDYALLPLSEKTMPESLKQLVSDGKLDISAVERFLAQGHQFQSHTGNFVYETMKKVPTTIGIPLQISNKMPLVTSIKTQVSAEVEPRNGQSIRGLRARVNGQVAIVATHITKMELWWPIVNSGVKVVASAAINLPLHLEVEINGEKPLKLTMKTPESEKRLFSVHTRPVTFVRHWPRQARVYVEPQEKTIHHEQQTRVSSVEKTYGRQMGLELEYHCQWHRVPSSPLKGTPMSILAGENIVELYVKPGQDGTKEIVFTIDGEVFGQSGSSSQESHRPEHKRFYGSEEDEKSYDQERFGSDEEQDEETYQKEKKGRRDNFEKYTKEYQTDKSYKHRVHMMVETKGGRSKQAELEVVAICDPQMRFCKFQVQAKRPAMMDGESRPWELRAKAQTLYPSMAYSLETLKTQEHREFTAQVEADWGSDKKYNMRFRIQGEQSRRARHLVEEMTEQSNRGFDKYNQKVDKTELLEKAAYLDQYRLDGDYEISPLVRNYTYKLYSWLKASQWSNVELRLPTESRQSGSVERYNQQSGRISAMWSVDPESRQYINLTISTPLERVIFTDIALPVPLRPINIRRNSPSSHSFGQFFRRTQEMNAKCSVDGKKVETFDDVEYKTKMTGCYVLLAKDCADEGRPSYAIMMKKTEKSGEEKTIKIITEQKEIEIEMKSGELKVKINGEHIREKSRLQEEGIEKQEDSVKVELEEAGIKVYFDGIKVQIKTASQNSATMCGLCGNYNGDSDDEWRMPNNQVTDDMDEFRRSYDHECQDQEYTKKGSYNKFDDEDEEYNKENKKSSKNSNRRGNDESRYNDEEETEPIKVTAVLEQGDDICFSKTPIHDCPRGYSIKESKKQTVPFVCQERNRSSLQKMRDARSGTVEVSGSPSFSDSVKVAVKCTRDSYGQGSSYGQDSYNY
jgi:HEAT repeat protein